MGTKAKIYSLFCYIVFALFCDSYGQPADTSKPVIYFQRPEGRATKDSILTLTVTFSEKVTDENLEKITASNASIVSIVEKYYPETIETRYELPLVVHSSFGIFGDQSILHHVNGGFVNRYNPSDGSDNRFVPGQHHFSIDSNNVVHAISARYYEGSNKLRYFQFNLQGDIVKVLEVPEVETVCGTDNLCDNLIDVAWDNNRMLMLFKNGIFQARNQDMEVIFSLEGIGNAWWVEVDSQHNIYFPLIDTSGGGNSVVAVYNADGVFVKEIDPNFSFLDILVSKDDRIYYRYEDIHQRRVYTTDNDGNIDYYIDLPDDIHGAMEFDFQENLYVSAQAGFGSGYFLKLHHSEYQYEITLLHESAGEVAISVPPGTFSDINGNENDTTSYLYYYDAEAPGGYSLQVSPTIACNSNIVEFALLDAEIGAGYHYSISDGVSSVSGDGTIQGTPVLFDNIDISTLSEGTLTLEVNLTDTVGNIGQPVAELLDHFFLDSSFGTDSIVCEGDPATLIFSGLAPQGTVFDWNVDGGIILDGSSSTQVIVGWDTLGPKSVSLGLSNKNCVSLETIREMSYNQKPTSSFEFNDFICKTDSAFFNYIGNATQGADYQWNLDGGEIVSGTASGMFTAKWDTGGDKYLSLKVSENGCVSDISEQTFHISPEPTSAEICMVTIDEASGKNMIVWNYPTDGLLFGVYRETNVSDSYALIDVIEGAEFNTYVDSQSQPLQQSNRYKVTAIDSCGIETVPSTFHKTIHLTINKGQSDTWNLIWDGYQGFSFGSYRIFRGTSQSNMELLAEVASNNFTYTDLSPPSGSVFYQIEVINPTPCVSGDGGRLTSLESVKSNIAFFDQLLGIDGPEMDIHIYPNPANAFIILDVRGKKNASYKLIDISGSVALQGFLDQTQETKVDVSRLLPGIYVLNMTIGNQEIVRKIIKE